MSFNFIFTIITFVASLGAVTVLVGCQKNSLDSLSSMNEPRSAIETKDMASNSVSGGGVDGSGGNTVKSNAYLVRKTAKHISELVYNSLLRFSIYLEYMDEAEIGLIFGTRASEFHSRVFSNNPIAQVRNKNVEFTLATYCDHEKSLEGVAKGQNGEGKICLSENHLMKIAPEALVNQMTALALHELSHLYGFNETDATAFQKMFLSNTFLLENSNLEKKVIIEKINEFLSWTVNSRQKISWNVNFQSDYLELVIRANDLVSNILFYKNEFLVPRKLRLSTLKDWSSILDKSAGSDKAIANFMLNIFEIKRLAQLLAEPLTYYAKVVTIGGEVEFVEGFINALILKGNGSSQKTQLKSNDSDILNYFSCRISSAEGTETKFISNEIIRSEDQLHLIEFTKPYIKISLQFWARNNAIKIMLFSPKNLKKMENALLGSAKERNVIFTVIGEKLFYRTTIESSEMTLTCGLNLAPHTQNGTHDLSSFLDFNRWKKNDYSESEEKDILSKLFYRQGKVVDSYLKAGEVCPLYYEPISDDFKKAPLGMTVGAKYQGRISLSGTKLHKDVFTVLPDGRFQLDTRKEFDTFRIQKGNTEDTKICESKATGWIHPSGLLCIETILTNQECGKNNIEPSIFIKLSPDRKTIEWNRYYTNQMHLIQ